MPTDRLPKPDTAAIRDEINRPIQVEGPVAISPSAVFRMADTIGYLCDYIDSEKVTVEQVREFVETYVGGPNLWGGFGRELLDFIDNGPEKPTAEQIAHNYVMLENIPLANAIVRGLREAGYLKDEA